MRLALLLAFVSSVFFTTEPADARPKASQVQAKKAKPARAKAPAKAKAVSARKKSGKAAKVVSSRDDDEPVVRDNDDEPTTAEATPAPKRVSAPRAQAIDDEVPRNEPKRR